MIGEARGNDTAEWLGIPVSVLVEVIVSLFAGVLICQERTGDAVVVEHVAAEVMVPTAIGQDDSLEGDEHRLADERAEIDAVFEAYFAVEIAVEVEAGDAAGPEVDFVVGLVVEVDAGDDAEFGLEESDFVVGTLMKIALSKFVLAVEDAQLQHTWTGSQ